MNRTENNKLIVEFMGVKFDKGTFYNMGYNVFSDGNLYCKHELKYHAEWNWLMPVVQKCYKIDDEEGFDNLVDAVSTLDFDAIYQAVLKFIKKYNEEKN